MMAVKEEEDQVNARVDNLLEAARYHLIITFVFKLDIFASISVINHSPFYLIKYAIPPLLYVHVLSVSRRVNNSQIELGLIFFFLERGAFSQVFFIY